MLEILGAILFCYLFIKAMGLALRLAWGAAKIAASALLVIAVPMAALCLLFAGGMLLLIPVALLGGAVLILKAVA